MENIKKVFDFYNNGAEVNRLDRGLGIIEFYRSKEIISQYITNKKIIYDIGECNFIDDDIYIHMLESEIITGKHNRPEKYPYFMTNAYFHTVDELRDEVQMGGFEIINCHAVEGCI